jgi:hypothetical protein
MTNHHTPSAGRAGRGIELAPLLGHWINYDEHSTGITQLDIGERDGTLLAHATSRASRGPVGWGEVAAAAFAGGVDGTEAVGFTAEYDFGYQRVLLAAYLNSRLLVLDAYSTFAEPSPRSSYFQRDHLYLR